jgi:succinyl-CoA synthetase beta subunit
VEGSVKLQEFHSRELLRAAGLPVPPGRVARTPAEVRQAAGDLFEAGHARVVVKAQVLVGGRGKAGGVKVAATPAEAETAGAAILGMSIKGITVRKVLVVPGADIVREVYLGAILDRAAERILVMGSAEGGVEIEEVARLRPEAIVRVHAHPHLGLLDFQARRLALALGLGGPHLRAAVAIAKGLVAVMTASDADLVEVNPLAIVRESATLGTAAPAVFAGSDASPAPERAPASVERLVCLDAKITLDDSALPRHADLEALRDLDEEDPADIEARARDINFIQLDGSIGCLVNGAGLAMTTMDLVKRAGGEPANFLDIGGGAKADKVAAAMRLILADPKVTSILVNIFGGITRGDEVAKGLVEARAVQERSVPMVVRIVGTNAAQAAEILRAAAFETATSLEEAAAKAVAAAGRPPTGDGVRSVGEEATR